MSLRVLVTGGAGFIGSHIAQRLVARGDEVVVADDLSTGVMANVPTGSRFERLDITDASALRSFFVRQRFDAVVHAAAQFSVQRSLADPVGSWRTNVYGTQELLRLQNEQIGRFVFLSTGGAIYGETPRCATEDTPLRPISPYGREKRAAEELVHASSLPYAILRPANVYGPRQRGDLEGGVVAAFLHRYQERKELVVYGDGSAKRDYVYVRDVVDCVIAVLDRTDDGIWNVGTGIATSVNGLIQVLKRHLGDPPAGIRYAPARAGDLQRACVDPSKAARDGMWQPHYSLDAGLRELLATQSYVSLPARSSGPRPRLL